jgi:hypothetical protein
MDELHDEGVDVVLTGAYLGRREASQGNWHEGQDSAF